MDQPGPPAAPPADRRRTDAWWDHAARVAAEAAAQIRTDPAAAADTAWATSDALHVAAAALGSRILRQAADAYDRAARAPYGRIPAPTPAGNGLRQAARAMSAFAYLTSDRTLMPVILITRLAALAEAVAGLRESQQRAAQAAAALAAAERLHAAARPALATPPTRPHAASLAATSFRRLASYHPAPQSPHQASTARTSLLHGRPADRDHPGRAAPPAEIRNPMAPTGTASPPGETRPARLPLGLESVQGQRKQAVS